MTENFAALAEPAALMSLFTLTVLETVLGIDNIIFISILCSRLPKEAQAKGRSVSLLLALFMRLALLGVISWIAGLNEPILRVFSTSFSGKDLILIGGGLFLLFKSVKEMHHSLEGVDHENNAGNQGLATMGSIIAQVAVINLVFSLDSVITAIGLTNILMVMAVAIILSTFIMLAASGPINEFVNRHPTVKMLALAFLLMVGVVLIADGFHHHVNKNYIYFAMAFSFAMEMLNIRMRNKQAQAIALRSKY
jgi:predicted tellurium resistance membrane protein TerC